MEMHKEKQGAQEEIRRIVWSGGGGLVTKSFISCARTLGKKFHTALQMLYKQLPTILMITTGNIPQLAWLGLHM